MEAYKVLESKGIKYKYFANRGCCKGTADGFPKVLGYYNTTEERSLENYKQGNSVVDIIGGTWVKVYEYYSPGAPPKYPSVYSVIYVKKEDYPKACEALRKAGITPVKVEIDQPSSEEDKDIFDDVPFYVLVKPPNLFR